MKITVDNLSFDIGKNKILDGVSFSVDGFKRIALLGENGVGKTTLLRCLCSLEKYEGDIYLDGQNLKDIKKSTLAKMLAYLPQNPTFSDSTVFDTVLTGRRPHIAFSAGERDFAEVEDALEKLGISDLAFKRTDRLSGGEQQKVAIARALVQKSKLLILDESSSNLDIKNKIVTSELISSISQEEDITVVSVMHDINSAISFADYFVFLKDKKVFKALSKEDLTEDILSEVFDTDIKIYSKEDGGKFVVF